MSLTPEDTVSYDLPIHVENLPEPVCRSVASYQSKMASYLLEIPRRGELEKVGVDHCLPAHFLRYFKKVMDLFDESLQFLLGYLREQGFGIRCHPRCCHCCYHMPVGISVAELLYLYHGMHQSGILNRLFRHCLEAQQSWTAVLLRRTTGDNPRAESEQTFEALLADYHQIEQPCPFLHNNLCQLYSYRPLACRMHFSLSPPHWCHPAHFQNSHAVRFNLEPAECVTQALTRLDERLQLNLSDIMVCGLLELTVNVMQFAEIQWLH